MAAVTPLERALIVQDCTQLIARFAQANDAAEWERVARLFTADGVFCRPSAPDQPVRGREEILAQFRNRPARFTRHVCANTVVDVLSEREARAVSYIVLYTAAAAGENGAPAKGDTKQLIGAFHDRIVKDVDGVWRFAERRGSLAMMVGG